MLHAPALARPGETLLATSSARLSGGKGANCAVAAACVGARVAIVGAVGDDADGSDLLDGLRRQGVDTGAVRTVAGTASGVAVVTVLPSGENAITVAAGANGELTAADVTDALERAAAEDVVAISAEIPAAAMVAAALGAAPARVVLNLAPFRPLDPGALALADPLVVNETEAGQLLDRAVDGLPAAEAAARALAGRARSAVVTAGAAGAVWATRDGDGGRVPAPRVAAVDTTGAGDALVGALAARLAGGDGLADAVVAGVQAASRSVQRPGAQASYS